MNRTGFLSALLLTAGVFIILPILSWGEEMSRPNPEQAGKDRATSTIVDPPVLSEENPGSELLTKEYCSACHGFQLVKSQRLDRTTWEWVMDDMVNEFNAGWITKKEQKMIIDYLVEHYGPED